MSMVVILREEVAPKRQVVRPQEHPAHGALHRAESAPVQKFLTGLTRYDDCGGTRPPSASADLSRIVSTPATRKRKARRLRQHRQRL
jgi:hypothetical protein